MDRIDELLDVSLRLIPLAGYEDRVFNIPKLSHEPRVTYSE